MTVKIYLRGLFISITVWKGWLEIDISDSLDFDKMVEIWLPITKKDLEILKNEINEVLKEYEDDRE